VLTRILLVDDDEPVLGALRRELLSPPNIGHEGLEIEAFSSPRLAIERAREKDGYFDVIVADYRMPELDGVALLEQLRGVQPDATRILLTGHADMEVVLRAINDAKVDYLIRKPWVEYDLKARIALAIHQRRLVAAGAHPVAGATAGAAPAARRATFNLMLVDDEPPVLRALERDLSMGGLATAGQSPFFRIRSFVYPREALEAFGAPVPDIVIADYLMPGMDGIGFLQQVRQKEPGAVRILLSGNATINVLMDAVNVAGVYHFLEKPWEAGKLREVIAGALRFRELLARSLRPPGPGATGGSGRE
jgi:two-component system probable response regulator PhcQ